MIHPQKGMSNRFKEKKTLLFQTFKPDHFFESFSETSEKESQIDLKKKISLLFQTFKPDPLLNFMCFLHPTLKLSLAISSISSYNSINRAVTEFLLLCHSGPFYYNSATMNIHQVAEFFLYCHFGLRAGIQYCSIY